MKVWLPVVLVLASSLPSLPELLREPPAELLPWLYNARERSAAARDAFDDGDPQAALEAAAAARELAPEDPRTRLNLGTALLAAGQTEQAVEQLSAASRELERSLEEAAAAGDADPKRATLASTAHYNRGNALFGAGDLAGAVAAYEQSLRRQPGRTDAKFNLELALEELERQQQQQGGQQGQGEDEQQQQPSGGQEPSPESPEQEGGEPQEPQPGQGEPQPQQGDPRLPEFEEQPDMTAQEAAAILEAVENLERRQRRLEAAQRARQTAGREKDW